MNFLSLFKRKLLYKIKNKINIDKDNIPIDKDLEYYFTHYGTDKASHWNEGKNQGHAYTQYYEYHLKNLRKKNINILEIGSYSGASAAAFQKFFNKSKVFCADINISNFKFKSKNIDVFGLDISKSKMRKNLLKKINVNENDLFFDFIIDDGSHKLSDILTTFKNLFKYVKSSGFYIIEDYKFPNYFEHLNDVNDIKINDMINSLKNKKNFNSQIIDKKNQDFLLKNISEIFTYKGNLKHSDICLIKKC